MFSSGQANTPSASSRDNSSPAKLRSARSSAFKLVGRELDSMEGPSEKPLNIVKAGKSPENRESGRGDGYSAACRLFQYPLGAVFVASPRLILEMAQATLQFAQLPG